jgi:hypothetical protein
VDITPPPLFLLTPRGGKEEKRGQHVDITSPRCLRRLRGGKKENGGSVWVAHRPIAVADATGRRGEKIGRCVGSTPPRYQHRRRGAFPPSLGGINELERGGVLGSCRLAAHWLWPSSSPPLLPLRLLNLLAPPRSSPPTPFIPSTPPRPPPAPHASSTSRRRP